jgi:hypothetical protein
MTRIEMNPKSHDLTRGRPKQAFKFFIGLLGQPPAEGFSPDNGVDHRLEVNTALVSTNRSRRYFTGNLILLPTSVTMPP